MERRRVSVECTRCGKPFEAWRRDAMYCAECKKLVDREKYYRFEKAKRTDSCPLCGGPKGTRSPRCRACANRAKNAGYLGERNPNWKGGRFLAKDGYIYVAARNGLRPELKSRTVQEHIALWEQANSQPLPKGWVIHHLNGVKHDNRIENLAAMPRHEHHKHPREALRPYERRILALEQELRPLRN